MFGNPRNTRGRGVRLNTYPSSPATGGSRVNFRAILYIVVLATTYYAGFITGMQTCSRKGQNADCSRNLSAALGRGERDSVGMDETEKRAMQTIVEKVVDTRVKEGQDQLPFEAFYRVISYFFLKPLREPTVYVPHCNLRFPVFVALEKQEIENERKSKPNRFSPGMADFATGAVKTNKHAFLKEFDYGYPEEQATSRGSAEVLILYNRKNYIPKDVADAAMQENGNGIPFVKDPVAATEQCDHMNVVVTQAPCLAVMSSYESYHVQRWLRIDGKLKHVGRGATNRGGDQFRPPKIDDTNKHWAMLQQYFDALDETIKELRPITERIKINNAIIVMVCNFGQSSLLMNFACSSWARGLDIGNVLVFATDKETLELAESLGMAAYYDERVRIVLLHFILPRVV